MRHSYYKRITNIIFILTFIVIFSFFIQPQKTIAQGVTVPVNDFVGNGLLGALNTDQAFFNSNIWTKEYVLDLTAYTAADTALNTISTQLQNKILNTLGNFVKDLKDELMKLENEVGEQLGIDINTVQGCFPDVDFSPVPLPAWNVGKFKASISCNLDSGLAMNAFYEPGGFNGSRLRKLSIDTTRYNAFGSFVVVQEELAYRKKTAKERELQELAWGRGLRAIRDGATGLIKTPAAAIQKQLDNAFSLQLNRMENADEVTEILVSILSSMVSNALTPEPSTYSYAQLPDTIPPATPTNLVAGTISSSQVSLTWSPSTDNTGLAGYTVYRNNKFLGVTVNTSIVDRGLNPNTSYIYTVTALDTAGNESTKSTGLEITTTL